MWGTGTSTGWRGHLAVSLGALSCLALAGPPAWAATPSVAELNTLSLEELADIEVTSVSRAPEPLIEAPAAIYVISREDIRRSGATSLPEALRLAPNLEVARLNSVSYAITARGFNSPQSANKLLVLIDGRSVYTPVASTVFWETLHIVLADIERIEVVSGPGGTLWGANAVNGVINVITRSAADTPGTMAEIGGGPNDRSAAIRHGGKLWTGADYRFYATVFDRESDPSRKSGDITNDAAQGLQGGFRVDGAAGAGRFTVQGDAYRNTIDLLDYRLNGANLLGRWTRPLGEGASLTVQGYYDRADRFYLVATDKLETFDVQGQVNAELGKRHRLVFGGGYRLWRSEFDSKVVIGFPDPRADLRLGNVFAQDQIALSSELSLILGLKLETNSYSGFAYLPNARLAWRPSDKALFWTTVSRAVRTPSRTDRELSGAGFLAPSPDFESEILTAYEAGARLQLSPRASLSVSGFYNVYDDLRTTEFLGRRFPAILLNGMKGPTYGVEAWGSYAVAPWWRLTAGVSTLEKDLELKPGHIDVFNFQAAGQDPKYQGQIRSQMNLGDRVSLDAGLRRVGKVSPSNVPAYWEADLRLGWRLKEGLELSLDGFNLLHEDHLEVINPDTAPVTRIPRSVYLSLRWDL